MIDLRLGSYERVLADEKFDAVICDPPFSERTHTGSEAIRREDGASDQGSTIGYDPWGQRDVERFIDFLHPRCSGWIVAICDHVLIPSYEAAAERVGRLCFPPLPCIINGMSVRARGDGPSTEAVFAMVMRPRSRAMSEWGTLRGRYLSNAAAGSAGGRGKPDSLIGGLVRDYSRRGDRVCDPCAGWGGTARMAIAYGRTFVGAEVDPSAHAEAMRRLSRPAQLDLLGE